MAAYRGGEIQSGNFTINIAAMAGDNNGRGFFAQWRREQ